ncbi:hypothetical protein ABTM15_20075, partial [Acinetobacter baumannii]
MTMADSDRVAEAVRHEMFEHIPVLGVATVRVSSRTNEETAAPEGHHAPEPFQVRSELADGELSIAATPAGERMRLILNR